MRRWLRDYSGILTWLGIALAYFAWTAYFGYLLYQQFELDWRGETVTGFVTDRFVQSSSDSTEYILRYRYDVGRGDPPQWYTGRDDVTRGFYDDYGIEDRIEVTFLPYQPDVSRVENSGWARVDLICLNIINMGLLVGLVFMLRR